MSEVLTLGEIYAMRRIEREDRAGVPHYVPGQHFARMLTGQTASLSFVDVGGHVCIVPVVRTNDTWHHLGSSVRVGQHTVNVYNLTAENFILSENMLAALDRAENRRDERRKGGPRNRN
jgi:hypothetical protein